MTVFGMIGEMQNMQVFEKTSRNFNARKVIEDEGCEIIELTERHQSVT